MNYSSYRRKPVPSTLKILNPGLLRADERAINQRFLTLGLLFSFIALLFSTQIAAADSLTSVLERIRVQETRHFSYRETRTLQLLAEPWEATGDMYISLQQMVIAQQTPTLVFTIISADRMQHINTGQDIDRSLKLESPYAVPGMEPFMQLLYGTTGHTEQEQDDVIRFDTAGQRWLLQLAPGQNTANGIIHMQLSGDSGHAPDHLMLEHADGDHTEWQLTFLSQGEAAKRELQQLLESIHSSP
jgi:hypothetical protein